MTPTNFRRALRSFSQRTPFRPFWVELVTGKRYEINHPEALALRGTLAVYVRPDLGYEPLDGLSVCRMFDSSLEELRLGPDEPL